MKKIKVYIAVVVSQLSYLSEPIETVKVFTSRKEMLGYAQSEKDCITDVKFFEDEIEIKED